MTREIRTYGLSEDALRERLADLTADQAVAVTLSYELGHGTVTVPNQEAPVAEVETRLLGYAYTTRGETLAAVVVGLLADHGLTVATAESCTGGLIAAALTDVPGASRVFGTGVVSYSNECKQALLSVSEGTLAEVGAVSAETAGQMARGVRRTADAAIGLSVTGEAGPIPAEHHPVGTVFIGLADKKRTWVEELHLDGDTRALIRRQAADGVLWLLWRYLSAYPAVMAGGETHAAARRREIPRTEGDAQPRLLSRLLPWKGDSLRRAAVKSAAWMAAVAVLVTGGWLSYRYLVEPLRNRELQDSLGDLYYEATDLTDGAEEADRYPKGMLSVFRSLYDMNEDVGGWLHIPHTNVDYPVMQYTDGFYRHHNFDKQLSIYGQLYLHQEDEEETYTRIDGPNTEDGQMFSDLLNYRRIAYLREHPVIEYSSLYEEHQWEIFAVLVLDERDPDGFSLSAAAEDDEGFLSELTDRSLIRSDKTVTSKDRILLLTTDAREEYGFAGARFVVAARLQGAGEKTPTYRVSQSPLMPDALTEAEPAAATKTTLPTAGSTLPNDDNGASR